MIDIKDLPAYLRAAYVKIEAMPEVKKRLDLMCANWMELAPKLQALSNEECLYIVVRELITVQHPRPEFVARPFFRAMSLSKRARWMEIQKVAPGVGYREIHGTKSRA